MSKHFLSIVHSKLTAFYRCKDKLFILFEQAIFMFFCIRTQFQVANDTNVSKAYVNKEYRKNDFPLDNKRFMTTFASVSIKQYTYKTQ